LRTHNRQRKGIALFTAIAFMLIMATIMALMLSMTAQTGKRGTDIYFQEQAYMLAKSATEYALLAISGHDRATNSCINEINSGYQCTGGNCVYDITTKIRYIGLSALGGTCDNEDSLIDTIVTPESNGTVMIDVYVTVDPAQAGNTEELRFHRRTLQKP
jgi:hypothetical protein